MFHEKHFGNFSITLVQLWNKSQELFLSFGDRIMDRRAQLQRIFPGDLKKELIKKFLTGPAVPDHNKVVVCSTMDSPITSKLMNAIPH